MSAALRGSRSRHRDHDDECPVPFDCVDIDVLGMGFRMLIKRFADGAVGERLPAPTRRSRAPPTGRGAHAGSPGRSAGQVGPAVTETINRPRAAWAPDPQPSATNTSRQITSTDLTLVVTARRDRRFHPAYGDRRDSHVA